MGKYRFNNLEKFVVWKGYECKCFWCGEPLEFKNTSIDQVIPESLLETIGKFEQIKLLYKLPGEFEINNFENWVPAHANCNSRKNKKIFSNSPVMLMVLDQIVKNAEKIKGQYEKYYPINLKTVY